MSDDPQDEGIKERLSRQGEEALGKIAEELATNPLVAGALARAFEAREEAVQAQEATTGALGIPSAADIERLTRRLRSVSQRLESIEDAVDRVDERLEAIQSGVDGVAASSGAGSGSGSGEGDDGMSERLDEIARDLAA